MTQFLVLLYLPAFVPVSRRPVFLEDCLDPDYTFFTVPLRKPLLERDGDGMGWDEIGWDEVELDGIGWDGMR